MRRYRALRALVALLALSTAWGAACDSTTPGSDDLEPAAGHAGRAALPAAGSGGPSRAQGGEGGAAAETGGTDSGGAPANGAGGKSPNGAAGEGASAEGGESSDGGTTSDGGGSFEGGAHADGGTLSDSGASGSSFDAGAGGNGEGEAPPGCSILYTAGHGDIFARYDIAAGELRLRLRGHLTYPAPSGSPTEPEHDPAGICIVVPYSSYLANQAAGGRPRFEVEGVDVFEPIGVPAGAAHWLLSANNLGAEQPFFGVATEGVPPQGVFGGPLRFDFVSFALPGEGAAFSVYQLPFIPVFHVSTSHPNATAHGAQRIEMAPGSHDHFAWAFSHPGRYEVSLVVSADRVSGGTVSSVPVKYVFFVEGPP